MLIKILKFAKIFFIASSVSITALFLYNSCSSNPASSPSAPIEMPMPAAIKFVEFSEIRTDFSYANQALGNAFASKTTLGPGDIVPSEMTEPIASLQKVEDDLFVPTIYGLSQLTIPSGEDVKTLSGQFTFPDIEGVLSRLSGTHNWALDFSDFDFDNDGSTEGCRGHTAALPICARLWLDNELYLVWIFDEPPRDDDPATPENEKTIGRGRYKIAAGTMNGLDQQIAVSYYEETSSNSQKAYEGTSSNFKKGYDGYAYGTRKETTDSDLPLTETHHFNTESSGTGTSQTKYYNTTTTVSFSDGSTHTKKSKGRYIDNKDLLRTSYEESPNGISEDDICLILSRGVVVGVKKCADIPVPEPFVSEATAQDTALPSTILSNVYGVLSTKYDAFRLMVDVPTEGTIRLEMLDRTQYDVPYTRDGNYYTIDVPGAEVWTGILIPGKYGVLRDAIGNDLFFATAIDTETEKTKFDPFKGQSFGAIGLKSSSDGVEFSLLDVDAEGILTSRLSANPDDAELRLSPDHINLGAFLYEAVNQSMYAEPNFRAFVKRGIAFSTELGNSLSIMSQYLPSGAIPRDMVEHRYRVFMYKRSAETGPGSETVVEMPVDVTEVGADHITLDPGTGPVRFAPDERWPGFLRPETEGGTMIRFLSPEAFIIGEYFPGIPWFYNYGMGLKE